MKKLLIILSSLAMLGFTTTTWASEGVHKHSPQQKSAERRGIHQHAEHGHESMPMDNAAAMFSVKKEVDGYTVSFHVMPAKTGMEHGGSHNLMVKVESNGAVLTDIMVNSKVFYADKSSDSKMLMKMGDWYMAGYELGQEGQHGIMVLFKTADGQKHKTSVYYPEEK